MAVGFRGEGVQGHCPWDDPCEQDRHGLRILASGGRDRHQGAPSDHLPALGRYRDFVDGIPVSAGPRVHAWRPLWSVRTMSSVIEMNSGEITYSGSPASCLGGQTASPLHTGDRGHVGVVIGTEENFVSRAVFTYTGNAAHAQPEREQQLRPC